MPSSPIADTDVDALAARFEAAAIPATEWTHHAHLIASGEGGFAAAAHRGRFGTL